MVVRRLLKAGVDPGTAASLTGHSVQVMLRYYQEIDDEDRREAAEQAGLGDIEPAAEPEVRRLAVRYQRRLTAGENPEVGAQAAVVTDAGPLIDLAGGGVRPGSLIREDRVDPAMRRAPPADC
jgi:hypothetical protein